MTEYIERKVLDKALTVAAAADSDKRRRAWVEAISIVHDIPAADVAPVTHATTTDAGWDEIYCQRKTCNRCQGDNVSTAIYCNWCGARFDGGESNG